MKKDTMTEKKIEIRKEEQEPYIENCGNIWRDGYQRIVIYPRPPRYFIYQNNKKIGEIKSYCV